MPYFYCSDSLLQIFVLAVKMLIVKKDFACNNDLLARKHFKRLIKKAFQFKRALTQ